MIAAPSLSDELTALEAIFDAALEAVMPNPVALRFTDLALGFQGKRDLVFGLDLLNEGENEAALIAGLAHDALLREPAFDVAHLVREAWYYLRTSIDPDWQFDETPSTFTPALAYIGTLVRTRVAAHRRPPISPLDAPGAAARRTLLNEIRSRS